MNNYSYAGFWIRFGAALIDLIVYAIVFMFPLSQIYGPGYLFGDKIVHGAWDILLGYIAPCIATIWFWRRFLGTPGKMALKLKVVDSKTGRSLTVGQSLGRYFAYIISAIPSGLGFIWIGVDNKKQGWHDKLAGSVVIRDNADTPVEFERGR